MKDLPSYADAEGNKNTILLFPNTHPGVDLFANLNTHTKRYSATHFIMQYSI